MTESGNMQSLGLEVELTEKFFPFEGVFNFRELGGYTTIDGRQIRRETLFRSDNLAQLTHRDMKSLKELKIQTVIDLRTDHEIKTRGSYEMVDGAFGTYLHLPIMDLSADPEQAKVDENYLEHRYKEILKEAAPQIAFVVETISNPKNHPLVFHCAVGKDRTGLIAMVILGTLGVTKEVIVSDYALTALAVKRMLLWLDEISPDMARYVRSLPSNLMSADPKTMSNVIDWLNHSYGSFDGYLRFIGVGDEDIESLRTVLVQ